MNSKPAVGIAWHHKPAETYVATMQALEAADGAPIKLGQVFSAYLNYDSEGHLVGCTDQDGVLTAEAAALVKQHTWHGSNVEEVMAGMTAVVFPGGGDISPTLYARPQITEVNEGYGAERDVSDYLMMSYCLDRDIPVLAICRGIQVLSVVAGATMIQDIPAYYEKLGIRHGNEHRPPEGPDRDFVFHDVKVTAVGSLLHRVTGLRTIPAVPSWHHQAANSVENTGLTVTGVFETGGVPIIEAVEMKDKTFVLGLQYHPEIAVVRHLDDISLCYFTAIVKQAAKGRAFNDIRVEGKNEHG